MKKESDLVIDSSSNSSSFELPPKIFGSRKMDAMIRPMTRAATIIAIGISFLLLGGLGASSGVGAVAIGVVDVGAVVGLGVGVDSMVGLGVSVDSGTGPCVGWFGFGLLFIYTFLFVAYIVMFNIWFTSKKLVVGEFEQGDVNWKNAIHESDRFGAGLNGRNSAKGDDFVIGATDFSTCAVRKELFTWSYNTAVGAPKIVNDWWDDAVMHMTRYKEVEFVEFGSHFGVG